ncbi:MAG: lysophospholipid acyltransferase family protein [Flavobacteriales bacterium]
MGTLGKFLRILYQGYLSCLLSLPMILLYPYYRYLLGKGDFDKVYRANRRLAHIFSRLSFIPARIHQKGKLPEASFIICPNHSSYLDILYLMLPFQKRFVFLGKEEIQNWPYFSMFFRAMNIPVPRGKQRRAREAYLRAAREVEKGVPVAIFPEGTIPEEAPELGAFKKGAFRLAKETGVPIVPVTFLDHWRIFPEGKGFWGSIRPGRSRIIVHRAIQPEEGGVEELQNLTREQILEGWEEAEG